VTADEIIVDFIRQHTIEVAAGVFGLEFWGQWNSRDSILINARLAAAAPARPGASRARALVLSGGTAGRPAMAGNDSYTAN